MWVGVGGLGCCFPRRRLSGPREAEAVPELPGRPVLWKCTKRPRCVLKEANNPDSCPRGLSSGDDQKRLHLFLGPGDIKAAVGKGDFISEDIPQKTVSGVGVAEGQRGLGSLSSPPMGPAAPPPLLQPGGPGRAGPGGGHGAAGGLG